MQSQSSSRFILSRRCSAILSVLLFSFVCLCVHLYRAPRLPGHRYVRHMADHRAVSRLRTKVNATLLAYKKNFPSILGAQRKLQQISPSPLGTTALIPHVRFRTRRHLLLHLPIGAIFRQPGRCCVRQKADHRANSRSPTMVNATLLARQTTLRFLGKLGARQLH